MDALNSPLGLNSLQKNIIDNLDTSAKAGIIIGGGDGRLARGIEEAIKGVKVYSVEPRTALHKYRGSDIAETWNANHYLKLAKEHKGFDFIIFQNIHEYWAGEVNSLKEILELLKPSGKSWLSFYNSSNLNEIGRRIPPFVTGFEQLGSPMDLWPRMDLSSWMIYFSDMGMSINSVWGVLQENAYDYCKNSSGSDKPKEVEWKTKDFGVSVQDIGDAYILGASIMCLELQPNQGEEPKTQFVGVSGNSSMIQSILVPHDADCGQEMELFRSQVQVDAQQFEGEDESHPFIDIFIDELKEFDGIKSVLVVGADWGADMLALKKAKKDWDIQGIEGNSSIVEIGQALMKQNGIKLTHFDELKKFPFDDNSFDLVVSLRYFSRIYYPLAATLAPEMLRVAKKGVSHFEDFRGPEVSLKLKSYDIPSIYRTMGIEYTARPLNIEDRLSGMYIVNVKK